MLYIPNVKRGERGLLPHTGSSTAYKKVTLIFLDLRKDLTMERPSIVKNKPIPS